MPRSIGSRIGSNGIQPSDCRRLRVGVADPTVDREGRSAGLVRRANRAGRRILIAGRKVRNFERGPAVVEVLAAKAVILGRLFFGALTIGRRRLARETSGTRARKRRTPLRR